MIFRKFENFCLVMRNFQFFLHLFIGIYLSQNVAKFGGGNFRFKEDIQP